MERDQERFYEDELDPREEIDAEQETDEVDELKFFLSCSSSFASPSTLAQMCR